MLQPSAEATNKNRRGSGHENRAEEATVHLVPSTQQQLLLLLPNCYCYCYSLLSCTRRGNCLLRALQMHQPLCIHIISHIPYYRY